MAFEVKHSIVVLQRHRQARLIMMIGSSGTLLRSGHWRNLEIIIRRLKEKQLLRAHCFTVPVASEKGNKIFHSCRYCRLVDWNFLIQQLHKGLNFPVACTSTCTEEPLAI